MTQAPQALQVTDESNTRTINIIKHDRGKIYYTINNGSKVYERIIRKKNGTSYITQNGKVFDLSSIIDHASPAKALSVMQEESEFDINQRFDFLNKFVKMTLANITSSLLICGQSGLGKSHTVLSILEEKNLVEYEDYIIIKGYATPKALYATLYENRDKVVIFDDCDSVLKDPISLNILKGALDSYAVRKISWLSKGFIDDNLPSSFIFNGQVIFISNISLDKIDPAVKGRTLSVDVTMSIQDRIDRMTAIAEFILPEFSLDLKMEVLDFIDEHKYEAKELNMRTFEKLIKVRSAYDGDPEWRNASKYILVNA